MHVPDRSVDVVANSSGQPLCAGDIRARTAFVVQQLYPSQAHRFVRRSAEVGQFPVRRTGDEVLRDDLFGASLFDNPAALEQDGPFAQPRSEEHTSELQSLM